MAAAEIRVRPARRPDREAITALLCEMGYPNVVDPNTFLWVLNHPEVNVFVAVDKIDRPIGMISLSHRPLLIAQGRVATIQEMIVTASWRGQGVGEKLLAAAITHAKGLSAKRIELIAELSTDLDISYFERRGFVAAPVAVLRLEED